MASAMIWPMEASALAEMAPTWAISLLVVQGLDCWLIRERDDRLMKQFAVDGG